jgi:polyisoprenoid-binding protein YceI
VRAHKRSAPTRSCKENEEIEERGEKTLIKRVLALGVALLAIAIGAVAYSFLKTPEEASGPIEAVPVVVEQPEAETETALGASADSVIFEIVQAESEARFLIDEVLNGAPNTVVGVTDQVAGEIAIYPDDPTRSGIGTIRVNARALATDNDFRNRAIKNRILNTDAYEFVTFTPTELVGLPASAAIGESYAFQVVGDLTVRDVTRPATFDATITPTSETRLEGSATTTILYPDFGLAIPQVPSVASVEDEVILEIEFVAVAK